MPIPKNRFIRENGLESAVFIRFGRLQILGFPRVHQKIEDQKEWVKPSE